MKKRNLTLRAQAREIIFNVHKYMQKEAAEGVNNLKQVQKRAADATGTSVNTVKRILKEAKLSDSASDFRTPGKKRHRKKPVTDVDSFDLGAIKRSIHNFYITNHEYPTIGKLRTELRSVINFQGSTKSLCRIIRNQGFQWYKTARNKKVLIERYDIRVKRIYYLERLHYFRQRGRPLIYTYESYVHVTHCNQEDFAQKKLVPKDCRIFLVHAGSEVGFIRNSLLMYESKSKASKTGDTSDDMTFVTYEKWLRTHLLPNLPPKSVVVIGNASYQNKQYETAPNMDSKRSVMEAWLKDKKINYKPEMLKPQLYNLIKLNKERGKKYSIDKLLSEHGHDVIRIPPHHPDLNPLEIAWSTIKECMSREEEFNSTAVIALIREKVNDMELKYDWAMLRDRIKEIESAYAKSDPIIDQMTEQLVIVEDDVTDSSSESCSDSDLDGGSDTDYSSSSSDGDFEPQLKHARNDHTYVTSTDNDPPPCNVFEVPIKTEPETDYIYVEVPSTSAGNPYDILHSEIKIEPDSN